MLAAVSVRASRADPSSLPKLQSAIGAVATAMDDFDEGPTCVGDKDCRSKTIADWLHWIYTCYLLVPRPTHELEHELKHDSDPNPTLRLAVSQLFRTALRLGLLSATDVDLLCGLLEHTDTLCPTDAVAVAEAVLELPDPPWRVCMALVRAFPECRALAHRVGLLVRTKGHVLLRHRSPDILLSCWDACVSCFVASHPLLLEVELGPCEPRAVHALHRLLACEIEDDPGAGPAYLQLVTTWAAKVLVADGDALPTQTLTTAQGLRLLQLLARQTAGSPHRPALLAFMTACRVVDLMRTRGPGSSLTGLALDVLRAGMVLADQVLLGGGGGGQGLGVDLHDRCRAGTTLAGLTQTLARTCILEVLDTGVHEVLVLVVEALHVECAMLDRQGSLTLRAREAAADLAAAWTHTLLALQAAPSCEPPAQSP